MYQVLGEDSQIYAMKEVYLKNLDDVVKSAYINEIKLLQQFQEKPEIVTLYDL